jgi:hypothetical protein
VRVVIAEDRVLLPGVSLERIGFGVGPNPTRFTGNARVNVLQILTLDGRLVLAFPSARQPYVLDPHEVGGGFPASFYSRPFTTATMGIAADEFLDVPVLGETKLGSGCFLYNYPWFTRTANAAGRREGSSCLTGEVPGPARWRGRRTEGSSRPYHL